MNFLSNKYARILTIALLVQLGAFYAIASRTENAPTIGPLAVFPTTIGQWQRVQEFPLEPEVQEVLKADDTLNRGYDDTTGQKANCQQLRASGNPCLFLFIAYFKTQRAGQSPHSPRNCLPGSGWEPIRLDRPAIQVPGMANPITINLYVTEHGSAKSVTLYWYQSHQRIVASESMAKIWSVADAIRYNRSDTSLVKVTIPVIGEDTETAIQTGYEFTRNMFPDLLRVLPQ